MLINFLHFTFILLPVYGLPSPSPPPALPFQPLEQKGTLRNFGVRFVALEHAREAAGADVDAYLDQCLTDSFGAVAPADERRMLAAAVRERADVEPFLRGSGSPDGAAATPWFGAYRRELMECLRFSEDEMVDQPVACMFFLLFCLFLFLCCIFICVIDALGTCVKSLALPSCFVCHRRRIRVHLGRRPAGRL
jgi:hypothetical protein